MSINLSVRDNFTLAVTTQWLTAYAKIAKCFGWYVLNIDIPGIIFIHIPMNKFHFDSLCLNQRYFVQLYITQSQYFHFTSFTRSYRCLNFFAEKRLDTLHATATYSKRCISNPLSQFNVKSTKSKQIAFFENEDLPDIYYDVLHLVS